MGPLLRPRTNFYVPKSGMAVTNSIRWAGYNQRRRSHLRSTRPSLDVLEFESPVPVEPRREIYV